MVICMDMDGRTNSKTVEAATAARAFPTSRRLLPRNLGQPYAGKSRLRTFQQPILAIQSHNFLKLFSFIFFVKKFAASSCQLAQFDRHALKGSNKLSGKS